MVYRRPISLFADHAGQFSIDLLAKPPHAVGPDVGVVAPKQQPGGVNEAQQAVDLVREHEPGQVEVELPPQRLLDCVAAHFFLAPENPGPEAREPLDYRRESAAGVGNYEFDVRIPDNCLRGEKVQYHPNLLEEVFKDAWREALQGDGGDKVSLVSHAWQGRVDENGGLAAVELCEDRVERRVAEVHAVVVCENAHAVGLEVVERVGDLGDAAFNVWEGQCRPKAETVRVAPFDVGCEMIAFSCEISPGLVVAPDQM